MIIGFSTHTMPEMVVRFFFVLFSTVQHPKIWSFAKGSSTRGHVKSCKKNAPLMTLLRLIQ
jgi:hypothetical protein